jgi:nucleoside-triphosphatase
MATGIRRSSSEKILVLTGPLHSGKTTLMKKAASAWGSQGIEVGGFLSEVRRGAGGIEGYDLLDLRDRTSRPFLTKESLSEGQAAGPFRMIPSALVRAGEILARDTDRDVVVVDEIGPLELAGGGLWPAFEAAVSAGARCFCVVRLSILEAFREKTAPRGTVLFRLENPGTPSAVIAAIAPPKKMEGG